jgi:hypothetical protein
MTEAFKQNLKEDLRAKRWNKPPSSEDALRLAQAIGLSSEEMFALAKEALEEHYRQLDPIVIQHYHFLCQKEASLKATLESLQHNQSSFPLSLSEQLQPLKNSLATEIRRFDFTMDVRNFDTTVKSIYRIVQGDWQLASSMMQLKQNIEKMSQMIGLTEQYLLPANSSSSTNAIAPSLTTQNQRSAPQRRPMPSQRSAIPYSSSSSFFFDEDPLSSSSGSQHNQTAKLSKNFETDSSSSEDNIPSVSSSRKRHKRYKDDDMDTAPPSPKRR